MKAPEAIGQPEYHDDRIPSSSAHPPHTVTSLCVLTSIALRTGCGGRRADPPTRELPRVYEPGDCAAVMALPGMTDDDIAEGVASMGITAVQNRRRAGADRNRAHLGHWVRWSVVVGSRDAEMRERGVVLARCPDRRSSLILEGTNATAGAALGVLQGGERLRVVGWLGEMGLVLATPLHVESVEVEAAPLPASPEVDATVGAREAFAKPDAGGSRRTRRVRR